LKHPHFDKPPARGKRKLKPKKREKNVQKKEITTGFGKTGRGEGKNPRVHPTRGGWEREGQ